jgi:hypothetical protein
MVHLADPVNFQYTCKVYVSFFAVMLPWITFPCTGVARALGVAEWQSHNTAPNYFPTHTQSASTIALGVAKPQSHDAVLDCFCMCLVHAFLLNWVRQSGKAVMLPWITILCTPKARAPLHRV